MSWKMLNTWVMKKYFAKYLPVEGKIDTTSSQHHFFDENGEVYMMNSYYAQRYKESWKLAELFLCSRDIQVGDKVTQDGVTFKEWQKSHVGLEDSLNTFFKTIGEISHDALGYVKKGDEFDEEQVHVWAEDNFGYAYDIELIEPENRHRIYCTIKGPCGHFH